MDFFPNKNKPHSIISHAVSCWGLTVLNKNTSITKHEDCVNFRLNMLMSMTIKRGGANTSQHNQKKSCQILSKNNTKQYNKMVCLTRYGSGESLIRGAGCLRIPCAFLAISNFIYHQIISKLIFILIKGTCKNLYASHPIICSFVKFCSRIISCIQHAYAFNHLRPQRTR